MIKAIWGTSKKPEASRRLAELLESHVEWDGFLYIGYPVIGTSDGAFVFDATLLSPQFGVVLFHLVEGRQLLNHETQQDEAFTKLQSRLLGISALTRKRDLAVKISVATFAPAVPNAPELSTDDYPVVTEATLPKYLDSIQWAHGDLYESLLSSIQTISTIRKGKKREITNPASRGGRIRDLEESIANLDNQQSAAVVETVDGVQRIRGLAGSGKTIVLALKVAYLHAQHPEWKIAVTFNTRSLKGQFERLINTFVIEQTREEPDWDRIDIIHAWGAPGPKNRDGMYYKFCVAHGIEYFDFSGAEAAFGNNKGFAGACERALSQCKEPRPIYDSILVDEAQDFSPHFLRLCYEFLTEPKRLVYAYDELQSLTNNSLPAPEEIFGKKSDETPRVSFRPNGPGRPKQDIILKKCYRNSAPILATAHALGFGIYRKPNGLVQIFDQSQLWLDVGYAVDSGQLADGSYVSMQRTEESSPKFLEQHSPIDDLIEFKTFSSTAEQTNYLVESIKANVTTDELRPEDIIVINPDPLSTRSAVGKPRSLLFELGINSSLAGISSSPDVFIEPNSVTFTGIFRAKGNEGAMVYIINAQDCYSSFLGSELATARSRLFTAITRSKAWVRVLGVGPAMDKLALEFEETKKRDFKLQFTYPTQEEREKLRVINRDMTTVEKARLKKRLSDVADLAAALEGGEIEVDDLPPDLRKKLMGMLAQSKAK